MVAQASLVSRELGISREEQDEWAFRSHQRAAVAQDAGRFADEIVPVGDVAADEGIRRDTTIEKLAALQPVFDPDGTTTAGNAPGVNDGASCVIVCSEEFAKRRGDMLPGFAAGRFAARVSDDALAVRDEAGRDAASEQSQPFDADRGEAHVFHSSPSRARLSRWIMRSIWAASRCGRAVPLSIPLSFRRPAIDSLTVVNG